ncbi:MAG: [LysW]-lysine hydrolase [Anaerolineales bacterium]
MDFETLLGLVSQYSPSGQEAGAVDWLIARMRGLGFGGAFRDGVGNVVGVLGEGPRQIVLLGHIDTVPGEIPVRVAGDTLYGRGTVDAKGPLACFVDAAARVRARAGWQIVVAGAVEEERDSDGARYVADQYRPDFLIVGEPSGWARVTLGYKGTAWAEVSVRQSRAHPAGARASACDAVLRVWAEVQAWSVHSNEAHARLFDQVLPTVRAMESGEDGFDEWARITIGVRLPPRLNPENWFANLEKTGAAHGAAVTPVGFPIPAYRAEKNTPLVRAFLRSIRAQGGRPGFVVKTGTADLNIVAPVWGCPAAVYGPGDSSLDHTPDERISFTEYARAVAVLVGVLEELMR